jgi:hypothetical protein
MKYINTVCGQNSEFCNVKVNGACSYHCALNGYIQSSDLHTNRQSI